jgi:hypothetical protein
MPVVELTPENLEEHGFAIRILPTVEANRVRFVIGIEKVPPSLERRFETALRIREGNEITLEATLQSMNNLRDAKAGYMITVPKDLLPNAELWITQGLRDSIEYKFSIPLSKFIDR